MAVRTPLYWDGTNLREMSSSMVSDIVDRAVYSYGANPSATVTVVSSGGNISPNMVDTRMTAGAASTSTTATPDEATTAEPGQATVTFDRMSQSNATVSTPTDTNNKLYPVYANGDNNIQAMNATDVFDTFISPAIDILVDGNDRSGTFRIHTSTSLAGHVLSSSTPVFIDTRANTGAYTAEGIEETKQWAVEAIGVVKRSCHGRIDALTATELPADKKQKQAMMRRDSRQRRTRMRRDSRQTRKKKATNNRPRLTAKG